MACPSQTCECQQQRRAGYRARRSDIVLGLGHRSTSKVDLDEYRRIPHPSCGCLSPDSEAFDIRVVLPTRTRRSKNLSSFRANAESSMNFLRALRRQPEDASIAYVPKFRLGSHAHTMCSHRGRVIFATWRQEVTDLRTQAPR